MSFLNIFACGINEQEDTRFLESDIQQDETIKYAIVNFIRVDKEGGYTQIIFYGWNNPFCYNAILDPKTYLAGSVVSIHEQNKKINGEKSYSIRLCENEIVKHITGCKFKYPVHTNTIKKIWELKREIKRNITLIHDFSNKLVDTLIGCEEKSEYDYYTKQIVDLQIASDKLYLELKDIIEACNDGWTPF